MWALFLVGCQDYVPPREELGTLELYPWFRYYGYVEPGLVSLGVFTLTASEHDVEVTSVTTSDALFTISGVEAPFSMAPGEEVAFRVVYAPVEAAPFVDASLLVESDAGPEDAQLIGWSAQLAPIVTCDVGPEAPIATLETVTLEVEESYDPDGSDIVEEAWTLVSAPAGSEARIDADQLLPDLPGRYVADVRVTDAQGDVSEPCSVAFDAVDWPELLVELTWDSADDLDLHLLAPGGTPGTTSDCHYDNCLYGNLDWGVEGVEEDDPWLDQDSHDGGPERIRIPSPAPGGYGVVVQATGATEATTMEVSVRVSGRRVWSTSALYQEGTVATVWMPLGAVTTPE